MLYIHEKSSANPGQLFRAFGPHQQCAAHVQSLPGTAGLNKYFDGSHPFCKKCRGVLFTNNCIEDNENIVGNGI